MSNKIFDLDLLKKYDKAGPRYTSYPTAPHFHESINAKVFKTALERDNRNIALKDLSLYFHIPFCDSLCYFCGCHMTVSRDQKRIEEYLHYLEKEVRLIRPLIDEDRKVIQLHWGGGTPTHLSPEQIRKLGNVIHQNFEFREDAEVSVEIDPRELTFDHLKALREVGFNRLSMGVQSFDAKVQEAVNRIQPEHITRQAIEWARHLGFKSLNIDLMYGLPFQTRDTFENTLNILTDINPDRVAVFNYAHLPSIIKHQRLILDEWLPNADQKLSMLELSIDMLSRAGYTYIGMDHFAKPDDELTLAMKNHTLYRNFQGYSTHAGINLIAFGISSIGMLSDLYVQNHKKYKDYYEALDKGEFPIMRGYQLNEDDIIRREVITRLMCHFELDKTNINELYDLDFDKYFSDSLEALGTFEEDGLVILSRDSIKITDKGRLLIRNIAMCFDAYIHNSEEKKPLFSKTV